MLTTKLSDLDLTKIGDTIQLVGAIYAGEGFTYLTHFPGELDSRSTVRILEMDQPDWLMFLRQTDLLEVEVLAKNGPNGEVYTASLRKSQRQIDLSVMWAVFKRDGYACCYCGRDDVPLTIDHLLRWEEGGPTVPENLLSTCKKCNKTRGRMSYNDWLKSADYSRLSAKLPLSRLEKNLEFLQNMSSIKPMISVRSR
jgi:hypothetical protein